MVLTNIVCNCSSITVKNVIDLIELYPGLSEDQTKRILNVGRRCGSCNFNSENIDINFSEVYKKLNK